MKKVKKKKGKEFELIVLALLGHLGEFMKGFLSFQKKEDKRAQERHQLEMQNCARDIRLKDLEIERLEAEVSKTRKSASVKGKKEKKSKKDKKAKNNGKTPEDITVPERGGVATTE